MIAASLELDGEGRVLSAGSNLKLLTGYAVGELAGQHWWSIVYEPERRDEAEQLARAAAAGALRNRRTVLRTKGGRGCAVRITADPLYRADGSVERLLCCVAHAGRRAGAGARVRDQVMVLNEAQRISSVGNWVWDIGSGKVSWSAEVYRIFGRDPDTYRPSYDAFFDTLHAQDRESVHRAVRDGLARGAYDIVHRIVRPDGAVRHVHGRAEVQRDAAGQPVRLIGTAQDVTDEVLEQERLRASEHALRTLVEQASEALFVANAEGMYTHVNERAWRLLGYARDELIGKSIVDLIAPEELPRLMEDREFYLNHPGEARVGEWHLRRKDGTEVEVEVSAKMLPDGRWVALVRDITEHKRLERDLRQAAIVFESTAEAIVIGDQERRILRVNKAFTEITGYTAEEVVGQPSTMLRSDDTSAEVYDAVWAMVHESGQWQGELWQRRKNGERYRAWHALSVVRDPAGRIVNYIGVFSDVSKARAAEERLAYLSHYDGLTGLPNRGVFYSSLSQALERAKRYGERVALLFLDLDRFKIINDTLGHSFGDRLLKQVAERLKTAVRAEDMVSRLGGDEFVITLGDIAEPEDAALIAEKILQLMASPVAVDGHEVVTSVSIGISLFPDDALHADDLAKSADAALHRAKRQGRGSYQFYTAELTARAYQHLAVEQGLRQALAREELVLHYQPRVQRDGRIVGMEALVRWRHPGLGLLYPDSFIPVAEDAGLIEALGAWVLEAAARQALAWRRLGLPTARVSVNVSGRQLMSEQFVPQLQAILRRTGLAAEDGWLELEITESVLQRAEATKVTLDALQTLGIPLAIDDFGIGYSSLNQLKNLPVNTLKIDRSFVRDIPRDKDDEAIAAAIIAMGHRLNLKVVAEGVETEAQLGALHRQGCDEYQGFLFSTALPAEELLPLLHASANRAPA